MLNTIRRMQLNTYIKSLLLVTAIWAMGVAIGCGIARSIVDDVAAQIRLAATVPGNWFLFSVKGFGPLLLAYLIARFWKPKYLLLLLFLKSAILGFTVSLFRSAFGSAGWLLVVLVFSCELLCCWLLIVYVLHLFCLKDKDQKKFFIPCLFLVQLITSFDCFILSPFTVSLFT